MSSNDDWKERKLSIHGMWIEVGHTDECMGFPLQVWGNPSRTACRWTTSLPDRFRPSAQGNYLVWRRGALSQEVGWLFRYRTGGDNGLFKEHCVTLGKRKTEHRKGV